MKKGLLDLRSIRCALPLAKKLSPLADKSLTLSQMLQNPMMNSKLVTLYTLKHIPIHVGLKIGIWFTNY